MTLQFIFITLTFLCTFTASNYKKGKQVISFFLLLYMFLLSAFSYTNNDANVYRIYWEGSFNEFYTKDIGFGVLFWLAHLLNLSYPVFRFIIYFGSFIILYYVLTKINGKDFFFVLVLYFMYVFFMDNIEMRNFAAYTMFLFAIFFLIRNKTYDFLKFLLVFAIAITLHKIIIVYLIPCIVYKTFKINQKNTIVLFDALFILLSLISVNKNFLIQLLNMLPDFIKEIPGIGRNLVSTNDNGRIINFFETILFYMSSRNMYKQIINLESKGLILKASIQYKMATLVYVLMSFSCFLVPFYVLSGDYMRVTRNLFLILTALVIYARKISNKKQFTISEQIPLISLLIINMINLLFIFRGNVQFPRIYDTFINNYFFNMGQLKYDYDNRFMWRSNFKGS